MDEKMILLVEDNSDDEVLTLRAFKKNNVTAKVVVVHNGAEALDFLGGTGLYAGRNVSIMPTIIILDLKMPRVGGLDVLREIRGRLQTRLIPVVILTSSVAPRDVNAAYSLGANSYLRKPVDFTQFTIIAQQLVIYWLFANETPPMLTGG